MDEVFCDNEINLESAQVQVGLNCVRAALLPCPPNANFTFATKPTSDLANPVFNELFALPVMENTLYTKTDTPTPGSQAQMGTQPTLDDIVMCDKETNTEQLLSPDDAVHKGRAKRSDPLRNSTIYRSKTFSPGNLVNKQSGQYVCKLNRSDSDSSMPQYKKGPFIPNSMERRSMRWKKNMQQAASKAQKDKNSKRTSLDLELDLQAFRTKQAQIEEEIVRLKEIKQRLEEHQTRGDGRLPNWVSENELMQRRLVDAEKQLARRIGECAEEERKRQEFLKRANKEMARLRKQSSKDRPEKDSFREKMAFFTSVNINVPLPTLPADDV